MRPFNNSITRKLVEVGGSLINSVLWFDHITSRRNELTEGIETFSDNNAKKAAIFATYSGRKFDDSDISVLSTLQNKGYSVFLISNGIKGDVGVCQSLISKYIWRQNYGFDLGAYRDAFHYLNHDVEQVLLINDSVYWPPDRFREMLEILELGVKDGGIIGITESFQRSKHIQSFCFLVAGSDSLSSFAQALAIIKNWRFKRTAVTFGELRITKYLNAKNQCVLSVHPYVQVVESWRQAKFVGPDTDKILDLLSKNVTLNPTQHFWKVIFTAPGGFLKRSLIENNPADLSDLPYLEK